MVFCLVVVGLMWIVRDTRARPARRAEAVRIWIWDYG
jgi:hypothetical protein